MLIGHRKEIRKMTFRALALRRSSSIRSDDGLTSESLCSGEFLLSTQLKKTINYPLERTSVWDGGHLQSWRFKAHIALEFNTLIRNEYPYKEGTDLLKGRYQGNQIFNFASPRSVHTLI